MSVWLACPRAPVCLSGVGADGPGTGPQYYSAMKKVGVGPRPDGRIQPE